MDLDKAEESEETDQSSTCFGTYFEDSTLKIFDEKVPINNTVNISSMSNLLLKVETLTPARKIFEDDTVEPDDNLDEHNAVSDVYRDVWIPSENTRRILCTIATSTSSNNPVDRENLTMPGLALVEEMLDPVKEIGAQYLSEEEIMSRNILSHSDVTQDERGLRSLIKEGCYRAAINLSARLLAVYGQGCGKINHPSKHTPHSLQLWFTRLSLLAKLKHIDVLETESIPFGNLDKPDMYYIFYPELYGTRQGSMASFSFRLLLAEIPMYCGKADKAIDNLFAILAIVNKVINNLDNGFYENDSSIVSSHKDEALSLWKARKCRTLMSIVNCSIYVKNYLLSLDVIKQLLALNILKKIQKEILISAVGRIYLLLGDVSTAELKFNSIPPDEALIESKIRNFIDKGFLAIAQNLFPEALSYFKSASELDPTNILLINNMAVCLLYTGKLKEAVSLMENLITVVNPVKSLQESIILNMCTLYELHTTHSRQFKIHLLRQINRFSGDHINIQCLKLT